MAIGTGREGLTPHRVSSLGAARVVAAALTGLAVTALLAVALAPSHALACGCGSMSGTNGTEPAAEEDRESVNRSGVGMGRFWTPHLAARVLGGPVFCGLAGPGGPGVGQVLHPVGVAIGSTVNLVLDRSGVMRVVEGSPVGARSAAAGGSVRR